MSHCRGFLFLYLSYDLTFLNDERMAKDPAFLFYSKDWLEGTAEMTSEEKGVYVDLLAHQHQKGSLPPETKKLAKLSGLSEPDFLIIWAELSSKFIANATGRLVNRKLNGIVSERLDKGWRNKIIGTLGSIIKYSGLSKEIANEVKQTFKVDDFLACAEENLSERLSEWYDKRLKVIVNANEDAIGFKDGLGMQGEGKDGWVRMPGPAQMNLELPEMKAGAATQFMTLGGNPPSPEQLSKLWYIFKTQNFTGSKFYNSPNDVFSHFINWSKTQKINGTQSNGNHAGTKLGTSEGRTKKAREWGSDFISPST